MSENTEYIESLKSDVTEHAEFIKSLKVGDTVAIFEGYVDDNVLSEVTSVTTKYIKVQRYPSLQFDRQTGNQVSKKRHYRYLYDPKELLIQKEHGKYKDKLVDLLNDATITADKFNKCYSALEKILNE